MPNYAKVQFIAWEIYTGPVYTQNGADHYPGIAPALGDRRWDALSQCLDISARVQFTKMAMEAAYQKASQDEDTLKIFMAPEFLYRGPAGAYLFDLLNGWKGVAPPSLGTLPPPYDEAWGGLFGELRALAADPRFRDWVFIFGTAVGAAFSSANGMLNTGQARPDEPPVSGWNLALIQCGGDTEEQRDACYFTEKHLKSGIDFVHFNLAHTGSELFWQEDVRHTSEPVWRILDRLIQRTPGKMGGALFKFPHIRKSDGRILQFGLEICLDHARAYEPGTSGTTVTGRLARSGAHVDIQLVPSCGMSLIKTSLALAPEKGPQNCSYAFNCDGLSTWDSQGASTRHECGGHVHLWSGSKDGPDYPPQNLVNIIDSFRTAGHTAVGDSVDLSQIQLAEAALNALNIDLSHISASRLWHSHVPYAPGQNSHQNFWPEGAGFVRVLDSLPLSSAEEPEAPADAQLLDAVQEHLDAFRTQYTLSSVQVTEKHTCKTAEGCDVDFAVELQATLKYDTACQLPHVRGMIKHLGINAPALPVEELPSVFKAEAVRRALTRSVQPYILEIMNGQEDAGLEKSLTEEAARLAAEKITNRVNELERLYIGQASSFCLPFRAAFDSSGTLLSVMAVAFDGSLYDPGLLAPAEEAEMCFNGERQLQEIIGSAAEEAVKRLNSDGAPVEEPVVYHRVRARDYANTWTSNPPFFMNMNISKWNTSAYPANTKGDCANYVSQAIHAGGIPMTSKDEDDIFHWFASAHGCSRTWEDCTALNGYFSVRQDWVPSDLGRCNAGGVIFLKNKDGRRYHVVMCVHNDTVVRLYSAHTHDRLRQVYRDQSAFGPKCDSLECWVFKNATID